MKKLALITISFLIFGCSNPEKEFYPNGNVKKEYYSNDKGEYDGEYTKYYENGVIEMTCVYEKGKRVGIAKWYYENGNLAKECSYANGLENGIYRDYYEDGKTIKVECQMVDGMSEGVMKGYYPSGKIQSISNRKHNKDEGEFKEFFESGKLRQTVFFENDEPIYLFNFNEKGDTTEINRLNQVKRVDGLPIDTIYTGDTLKLKAYTPGIKLVSQHIGEYGVLIFNTETEDSKKQPLRFKNPQNDTCYFDFSPTSAGTYRIEVVAFIKGTNGIYPDGFEVVFVKDRK